MFAIPRRSLLSNRPSVFLAILILGSTPVVVCAQGQMQAKSQPANLNASLSPAPAAGAKRLYLRNPKERKSSRRQARLKEQRRPNSTRAPEESLPSLALHYLPQTCYMTRSELEAAMQQANAGKIAKYLKPGTQLTIPGIFTYSR